jgi:hypothetical protein
MPGVLPYWAWTAFLILFPCIGFFPSISLLFFLFHFCFCCYFVSPLPFPLLFTNSPFSPFLCFLLFHIDSFSALPVLLIHFSSCPSVPQLSTNRLHPPLDFTLSFNPHYCVAWSPGPAHNNFTMKYNIYPLLFCVLYCY